MTRSPCEKGGRLQLSELARLAMPRKKAYEAMRGPDGTDLGESVGFIWIPPEHSHSFRCDFAPGLSLLRATTKGCEQRDASNTMPAPEEGLGDWETNAPTATDQSLAHAAIRAVDG